MTGIELIVLIILVIFGFKYIPLISIGLILSFFGLGFIGWILIIIGVIKLISGGGNNKKCR